MKVKEEYSEEFVGPDGPCKVKVLRENEEYILKEVVWTGEEIKYSSFDLITQPKGDDPGRFLISLKSPNPNKDDTSKDLFLKYQTEFKEFMINYFDLISKEISGFVGYNRKLEGYDLSVRIEYSEEKWKKIREKSPATIINSKDGVMTHDYLGFITIGNMEENKKLAEQMINYFEIFKYEVTEK